MSKQYWHCDICGGNFDLGENCDCEPPMMAMESDKSSYHIKKEIPVFGKTNELLVISADINKLEMVRALFNDALNLRKDKKGYQLITKYDECTNEYILKIGRSQNMYIRADTFTYLGPYSYVSSLMSVPMYQLMEMNNEEAKKFFAELIDKCLLELDELAKEGLK